MRGKGIVRESLDLPVIETPRMVLRIARLNEVPKICRYLRRNREHLRPWEPLRDDNYFNDISWAGAPERDQTEARYGEAYRFRLLLADGDGEFIGTVGLRNVTSAATCSCTLGYSLDFEHQGQGLMKEALEAVIAFAFGQLGLRRIEACYMPANERSARLLASLGFETEGLLRSSLEVNGRWEDHVICSRINWNWKAR